VHPTCHVLARLRQSRDQDGYQRWVRRTDGPLLALALVLLVVILLPLLQDLGDAERTAISAAGAAAWAAFTVDYGVRLYLSPRRWDFVRNHPLDLILVVVPFLRPLRVLHLLRLLSVASLLGVANRRAHRSLHARVGVYVGASAAVVLVVAGVAMTGVERRSDEASIRTVADGLWWAAATVTTVGYGDLYPVTGLGRGIAVALMVVGIALLGAVTASIAAWFVGRLQQVEQTAEDTEATLQDVLHELRALRRDLTASVGHPAEPHPAATSRRW
jgi:voltage-gated potassium channel